MNGLGSQIKTLVRVTTAKPGHDARTKTLSEKVPTIKRNLNPVVTQSENPSLILCPNETQFDIPYPAISLCKKYGLLPYQAKLISELQGYDMGGAK